MKCTEQGDNFFKKQLQIQKTNDGVMIVPEKTFIIAFF